MQTLAEQKETKRRIANEARNPAVQRNPYYEKGVFLRAKQQGERLDSGRIFHTWALHHVPATTTMRVLDAGCGWGRFTWALIDEHRISPSNIICSDLSENMLSTAVAEAIQRKKEVHFCACNIEQLPFAAASFDLVMANHMLYDVEKINVAVSELCRVMHPAGYFLATTHSEKVRATIVDLHYQALEILGIPFAPESPSSFSMENGGRYLHQAFRTVSEFYFEDNTTYFAADAFVKQYLTIGRYRNLLARPDIEQAVKDKLPAVFQTLVQDIIARTGVLNVPTSLGAFVCREPHT